MKHLEAGSNYCERHFTRVCTVLLVALFALYLLEFLRYRPYDIDNPWFLSFSYGQHVHGVTRDTFFSQPFPLGMDGTYLFGRIAAAIQSAVAVHFDWQQRPVAVLSAVCITLALACFIGSLRRRGHEPFMLCLLLMTAGISEPVLSAAVRMRYEPFSYLFLCIGLLLSTYDQTFLAVFVAALAIEIEPAAMLGVIPVVLACVLPEEHRNVRIAKCAIALIAALAVDLLLHPVFLHPGPLLKTLHDTPYAARSQYLSVLTYFLTPRHLAESVLLIAGPWLFLRNGSAFLKQYRWEILSFGLVVFACPVLKHPNAIYMIFLYPLLLLVLLTGLKKHAPQLLTALAIVAYFVPQYAYAAWANHGQGYSAAEMREVNQRILQAEQQAGLAPSTQIVGDYSLYFAHPAHFHASIARNIKYFPVIGVVACFDRPHAGLSRPAGAIDCNHLKQWLSGLKPGSDMVLHGDVLHILARTPAAAADAQADEK